MDHQICALRIVDKDLARRGIARKHEGKAIPFEAIADWAVVDVNRRKALDRNSIAVVDHARPPIVGLMDFDLRAGVDESP